MGAVVEILAGGEVITEEMWLKLENTKLSQLGRARKVVVDKDPTTIIDGAGESDAIKARIKRLKAEIETTDSDFDREKLQECLAKLSGGVAVVKVGAATETEMKEKKRLVADCRPSRVCRGSCDYCFHADTATFEKVVVVALPQLRRHDLDGEPAVVAGGEEAPSIPPSGKTPSPGTRRSSRDRGSTRESATWTIFVWGAASTISPITASRSASPRHTWKVSMQTPQRGSSTALTISSA